MNRVVLCALLLVPLALPPSTAEQTGTYLAVNPWNPHAPDCHDAPAGASAGLGGACFTVPAGATRFRVTLQDDVQGAGFGALNLCGEGACWVFPICDGVAEDAVPAGATGASVAAYDAVSASSFCGPAALAWAPTRGTITLAFTAADA